MMRCLSNKTGFRLVKIVMSALHNNESNLLSPDALCHQKMHQNAFDFEAETPRYTRSSRGHRSIGNSIYDHAQREMSDLRFGIKLRTTSFYFRFIFVLFRRRSTTYSIACTKMVNDDRK